MSDQRGAAPVAPEATGPTPNTVYGAIRIALSYTPIEPDQLADGCLSDYQCADAAQRILAAFHHYGWTVTKKVPRGWD